MFPSRSDLAPLTCPASPRPWSTGRHANKGFLEMLSNILSPDPPAQLAVALSGCFAVARVDTVTMTGIYASNTIWRLRLMDGASRPFQSPCRCVAVSLCRCVAVSLCRRVAVSPCRRVAVSPCRRVAVSLCRRVAVSLCRCHSVVFDRRHHFVTVAFTSSLLRNDFLAITVTPSLCC